MRYQRPDTEEQEKTGQPKAQTHMQCLRMFPWPSLKQQVHMGTWDVTPDAVLVCMSEATSECLLRVEENLKLQAC